MFTKKNTPDGIAAGRGYFGFCGMLVREPKIANK